MGRRVRAAVSGTLAVLLFQWPPSQWSMKFIVASVVLSICEGDTGAWALNLLAMNCCLRLPAQCGRNNTETFTSGYSLSQAGLTIDYACRIKRWGNAPGFSIRTGSNILLFYTRQLGNPVSEKLPSTSITNRDPNLLLRCIIRQ